jgi:diacylglycerol kinase (ATP)
MTRAGVIINPNSGRGNGKGTSLAAQLAKSNHVTLRILEDFTRLTSYMREMAQDDVTDLFISSGDGTVQAIQSLLAEKPIFKTIPRICILPHGSTNLTAADLGFKHRNITAQVNHIINLSPQTMRKRHSLRILNPREGAIRHGMTLGLGAASEATRHAQVAFNDQGVKGPMANFATIAGTVSKSLFSKVDPADQTRIDRPYEMTVHYNSEILCDGPQLMLIATTLEKTFFNIRPFWGGKTAPIRLSVFPYPVPNLVRWLLPMMYGGENRKAPKGAFSRSVENFSVRSKNRYVLDGEFFYGPENAELKIEVGPEFTFICG